MAKSSLVQASVATMQNPMGCETKANGHCPLPRLSISSRSASVVASMDASCDGTAAALHSVMKWKTVLAVFIVVVLYLVCGGLAFNTLEQTNESNQKTSITMEKALFLERNPCVTPDELEAIIKVSGTSFGDVVFTPNVLFPLIQFQCWLRKPHFDVLKLDLRLRVAPFNWCIQWCNDGSGNTIGF